ncbi:unnamed protein product [Polarella glacialis]|uniref:Uncharacterized protein n=1 Tax=Polarella glacialis TaxID=89957 RepID=A0A813JMG3_POLGL|nr:unnamed protein product [Polarella glacialis]
MELRAPGRPVLAPSQGQQAHVASAPANFVPVRSPVHLRQLADPKRPPTQRAVRAAQAAAAALAVAGCLCRGRGRRRRGVCRGFARAAVQGQAPPELSAELESFLRSAGSGGPAAPGKGGDASLEGIRRAEAVWQQIRDRAAAHARGQELQAPAEIVQRMPGNIPANVSAWPCFDVAVCGGTLGVLLARALQNEGLSVCIVERGEVKGRAQEWNVSPSELAPLVSQGVVSQEEVDASLLSRWPASRVGIQGAHAVEFQAAALNAGVSPDRLIAAARARFEAAGGCVLERAGLAAVEVYDDMALLRLAGDGQAGVRCQLVVDAMGSQSPIVAQSRGGAPPDAACLVVGTMASGFPKQSNITGDYLYSSGPVTAAGHQPFWEAFPSASGGETGTDRTTYYFAYVLPGSDDLPAIADIFQEYVEALPGYQGVALSDLTVRRALCSSFVAYRDSPLASRFDRVLQVGDAAGVQSPLSFGGFGALCRHLPRLRTAISEAVSLNLLSQADLALLNPYLPNLSLQWTMYRSIAQPPPSEPEFVNRMMGGILSAAARCGEEVMMPILQDVFSLSALVPTLASWLSRDPGVVPLFVGSMGVDNVLAAIRHLTAVGSYSALSLWVQPLLSSWVESLPPAERFVWRRRFEAWRYGSGLDYEDHSP